MKQVTTIINAIKSDIPSSIVTFLVALPLSMGIAFASGVDPSKAAGVGIATGVIGGIVVGLFSGCRLQVSGPAAGLAVIVGQLISEQGYETLGIIVLLSGLIQLASGKLGLGQWFRAVSPAVIEGMLAGIGMLILAAQFHVMVDDTPPGSGHEFGGFINLMTIPKAVVKGLTLDEHRPAAIMGVTTILAIVMWTLFATKKMKIVPAPLVGVVVAVVASQSFSADVNYINVPSNILNVIQFPSFAVFGKSFEGQSVVEQLGPILLSALALAFVASAESLLTASAVDAIQNHTPRTNYDRELMAQGLGNIVSGSLGLLPITGVAVRSITNVQAGAKSRASTILHGVWLLFFVLLAPNLLRMIPISSLAAILVYTGYKLMKLETIRKLATYGKGEVIIFLVTFFTVVLVDLLAGIVVGVALALVKLMTAFSALEITITESPNGETLMKLQGAATFIRLPKLACALDKIAPGADLHVLFDELTYIDHACLDLLYKWDAQHEATGGNLTVDWDGLSAKYLPPKSSKQVA
jgi:MFS superfamily sulfate permease-like transporter